MGYTKENIIEYVALEDVKFIRLVFIDIYGNQKNISIMPNELKRVFDEGYTIQADEISGFSKQKIVLHPDPNTISVLPWRPSTGRVVRMFCDIKNQDGSYYYADTRHILKEALKFTKTMGVEIEFRTEFDFYLFKLDEEGNVTNVPYDKAGYMEMAPQDKGENVRREICLSLDEMEIKTCGSYHEAGPGQNKICIVRDEPLTAAENSITFESVVKTIAARNGLSADFSHMPLKGFPVSKHKIVVSSDDKTLKMALKNLKNHYDEMYLFLNKTSNLYVDYDEKTDITYDSYLHEMYIERISSDYNPYLVYALILYAIFDSKENQEEKATSLDVAKRLAKHSTFIHRVLPQELIDEYSFE